MIHWKHKAVETAAYIGERVGNLPEIGLFTGTGLGASADSMSITKTFDYGDIPHFPVSTVESHQGRLLFGNIGGKNVMALQGRFHLYEGYSPQEVTFPVRVMQEMGIKTLIITNAAGGFNPAFSPGDIMIIRDHINLTGANPLAGPNEESWGIRFPNMNHIYTPELAKLAQAGAQQAGLAVHTGVYAGLKGPSLETPAEVRFLKLIGADAVGFSTVQEVIAGVHAGMNILGLSTITNVNDPDHPVPANIEEIIDVAGQAVPGLERIIRHVAENMR